MIHARDIRTNIDAVLRNEMSLEDLSRWIMANSWNMHRDSSPEAVNLASILHLLLAERETPDQDVEFRASLGELLNDIVVSAPVDTAAQSALVLRRINSDPWLNLQVWEPTTA